LQIAAQKVAAFHYTLTNDAAEVLDSSRGKEPLSYLHGSSSIIKGLEDQMEGKAAGDKFTADIAPADAYGERIEALVQAVPRSAFQGIDEVQVGMRFQAETEQGPITVTVTEVADDSVTVDGNHPLAGESLHFEVEVVEVRDATPEELEHGHVHGDGDHQD